MSGLGETLDTAPHSGLARPDQDRQAGLILCFDGQQIVRELFLSGLCLAAAEAT